MDENRKILILQAEIAALLHDIGKLNAEFIKAAMSGNGAKAKHTTLFLGDNFEEENAYCSKELRKIMHEELSGAWSLLKEPPFFLTRLGDILYSHHGDTIRNLDDSLLVPLSMIADIIDSSSSKGGAAFRVDKDVKRQARLSEKHLNQVKDALYLAAPLGGKEYDIALDELQTRAHEFQKNLAAELEGFNNWTEQNLLEKRENLFKLLEEHLSRDMAETRLPTNDVTLWQHSYSTAAIFKAMLARHVLLEHEQDANKGDLLHHKEKLAFLGVRWSLDALLANAVRPPDVIDRVDRADQLADNVKSVVETGFCLGNQVYRDRDGVVFLIPSPSEDERVKNEVDGLVKALATTLEDPEIFKGDLEYKIVCKDVGIQVLGLADLLLAGDMNADDSVEVLSAGPRRPLWETLWKDESGDLEICSRCGLRPISLVPNSVGSEADKRKLCDFCRKTFKDGANSSDDHIYKLSRERRKEIFGVTRDEFMTFETDRLVKGKDENKRVALVQGLFDLRPFLSGEAFNFILARRPDDYTKKPKEDDKSLEMQTWKDFHSALETCWSRLNNARFDDQVLHTFQQAFKDSFLGNTKDGRAPGDTSEEKLRNYLNDVVLNSPYPAGLPPHQKMTLYALRQHPAPSRIARVWETTEKFCRDAMEWFEDNKIDWFPISLDPGGFMVLMPADRSWEFLQAVYQRYCKTAGRVRHLLPFHLSAAVFYYKSPLYVGIDAMKRFSRLALEQEPVYWTLKTIESDDKTRRLTWLDHRDRDVYWEIPAQLPNGKQDRFYTWFQVEGKDRPYMADELEPGMRARVRPSFFDFEVLDATTRRYDIKSIAGDGRRPHYFCGLEGPRPYPLSHLATWENLLNAPCWKNAEHHQKQRLIHFLSELHMDWRGADSQVIKAQAADYLTLCLGKGSEVFRDAAATGALFDMFEWRRLITKNNDNDNETKERGI